MPDEILNNLFKTKDIYLASTLVALGFKYFLTKKEKQFFFSFEDNEEEMLHVEIANYWDKNLEIDAITLFNAFKELKSRMYE